MINDRQLQQEISNSISLATGQPFNIEKLTGTSGGCINASFIANDDNHSYFIKTNRADAISMFEAEQQALDEMAKTKTIRVPLPVCTGHGDGQSWLVLEHLQLQRQGNQQQLGERLAAMHKVTASQYGLSLIHISEPTRQLASSRMPSSA